MFYNVRRLWRFGVLVRFVRGNETSLSSTRCVVSLPTPECNFMAEVEGGRIFAGIHK